MNKAVLFVTFNRLDYVKETFEQIRKAKPPRFYIASDGPREHVEGEKEKIQEVRDYILSNIDWDCDVKTRFLDKNSGGSAYNIPASINWMFECEKDGIIIEEDCVPNQSFFKFCEELLDKYKDDKRVWHITGDGACPNLQIKESYYFAKIQHCWGWASWADRWKHFKLDITDYNRDNLKKFSDKKEVQQYWSDILTMMQAKPGFAWDYQWTFIIVANNGYCINPTKNLVSNIGVEGEHYSGNSTELKAKTYEIENIVHPKNIEYNWNAIDYIYTTRFGIKKQKSIWYKQIFSIENQGNHKVLTILGLKIKFKRKIK